MAKSSYGQTNNQSYEPQTFLPKWTQYLPGVGLWATALNALIPGKQKEDETYSYQDHMTPEMKQNMQWFQQNALNPQLNQWQKQYTEGLQQRLDPNWQFWSNDQVNNMYNAWQSQAQKAHDNTMTDIDRYNQRQGLMNSGEANRRNVEEMQNWEQAQSNKMAELAWENQKATESARQYALSGLGGFGQAHDPWNKMSDLYGMQQHMADQDWVAQLNERMLEAQEGNATGDFFANLAEIVPIIIKLIGA
mgnify:FL=1|jgi:hypothetical protein